MSNNDDRFLKIDFSWLDGPTGNPFIDSNFVGEEDVRLIVSGLTTRSLKIALAILDRAQTKVPVDTGFLKSTGYVKQLSDGFEVGYDADYAIYVHEMPYKHEVGQSKFLEDAYYEVMAEVMSGGWSVS